MKLNQLLSAKSVSEILTDELNERMKSNANYSMRSFALKLKLQPSGLSEILNGKRGLSRKRAEEIGDILNFNSLEREFFIALSEGSHGRSKAVRVSAQLKAEKIRELTENPIAEDHLRVISGWWHLAIVELTRTKGFSKNPVKISRQLGISVNEVREAIQRLLRLKLLRKTTESLRPTNEWLVTSTHDVPSMAVRNFHRELIQKAIHAIDEQRLEERNLTSMVFALDLRDEKQLHELKSMIMEFNRRLNKVASSVSQTTGVYCFSTQLFRLDK